jgi:transposase
MASIDWTFITSPARVEPRLGVHEILGSPFSSDAAEAFPGHGQQKAEQAEIARLKREVTKLKAERDILKKAAAYFAKEST